LAIAEKKKATD